MIESFKLALKSLVRSHVVTMLLLSVAAVHFFLPALVRSDGTADGWREMFVRAVAGFSFAIISLTVLACACGFFARERERFRLSLTMVRPVSAFSVAAGKWLALCAVAASAIAFSGALTLFRINGAPACMHHYAPMLPHPEIAAREAMDEYLAHPKTPDYVKKSPRAAVLRLLTNKELERYDVVNPGNTFSWPFSGNLSGRSNLIVRVRFATRFDLRSPLNGEFILGNLKGRVSNNTQSIVDVPLVVADDDKNGMPENDSGVCDQLVLTFANNGSESVMLRPRRDLELLVPADAFAANLLRASLQMLSSVALLAAFGLFLSSAFSRPVSVFVSLIALAVTLMAPNVIFQFPDEMDAALCDRIGLAVTRCVYYLTSSAGDSAPVSDLATGTCIEWASLAKGFAVNAVLFPGVLLALTAYVIRRKPIR